jgi:hypothetical protein
MKWKARSKELCTALCTEAKCFQPFCDINPYGCAKWQKLDAFRVLIIELKYKKQEKQKNG